MARVQLIHWKEAEGRARADELRGLGHSVQYEADGSAAFALLRREPVDVVVIDGTLRFAHGRGAVLALRQGAGTRSLPLVVLGGDVRELSALRTEIAGVVVAPWDQAREAIEHALASPSGGGTPSTPRAGP